MGFCFFFVTELLIRFGAFKKKLDCFQDAWFVFDSILVIMMVLETWVMTLVILFSAEDSERSSSMGNASVLRIARLLRLSRMTRMARLLRAMPELMILIKGMVSATRSVFFTFCLLALVMYVFAIAFTQMGKEFQKQDAELAAYFLNVPASMYTLWIHGALLDDLSRICGILARNSPYGMLPLFFVFMLLGALTIMNMLIGVLCEVV